MRAVADIDPRGAGLRAVTVVVVDATVICKRSAETWTRRRLGERGSQRRLVFETTRRRESVDRESGAPTHAQRDGVAA